MAMTDPDHLDLRKTRLTVRCNKSAIGTSGESAGSAKVAVVGGWEKVYICNLGLSRLPFIPLLCTLSIIKAVHASAMFGTPSSFSVLHRRWPLDGKCLVQKRKLHNQAPSRQVSAHDCGDHEAMAVWPSRSRRVQHDNGAVHMRCSFPTYSEQVSANLRSFAGYPAFLGSSDNPIEHLKLAI